MKIRFPLFAGVLMAILFSCLLSAQEGRLDVSRPSSHPETETAIALRSADSVLKTYFDLLGEYPNAGDGVCALDDNVLAFLVEPFAEHLRLRDGWGNLLYFAAGRSEHVVLSMGPNGRLDAEQAVTACVTDDFCNDHDIQDFTGDDVVLNGNSLINGFLTTRNRRLDTFRAMKAIEIALGSFAVDTGFYPCETPGLRSAADLRIRLVPKYLADIPLFDGWDGEIMVWCNREHFAVVSFAADGLADEAYGQFLNVSQFPSRGRTNDSRRDIVIRDGELISWPRWEAP
jgi:hypothetical protein